jgi:hypothetical protein
MPNGAAYAAAIVRLALAEPEPALDALRRANASLRLVCGQRDPLADTRARRHPRQ